MESPSRSKTLMRNIEVLICKSQEAVALYKIMGRKLLYFGSVPCNEKFHLFLIIEERRNLRGSAMERTGIFPVPGCCIQGANSRGDR